LTALIILPVFTGELVLDRLLQANIEGSSHNSVVDGVPCLARIEDMAALYVKEIQGMCPHGPYFLGGYGMGSTIA
jgi:thioesterase domain-containing protein